MCFALDVRYGASGDISHIGGEHYEHIGEPFPMSLSAPVSDNKECGWMNSQLFDRHQRELFTIIDNCGMSNKEIKLRKSRIRQSVDLIRRDESTESYALYNQRAHEIDSIPFLQQFGALTIAEDSRNAKGCDFVLKEHIYIECVCSSEGDLTKNKLDKFRNCKGLYDYGKKNTILNTRFSSSLCDKKDFYNKRVGKSIPENYPYIIFLKTGSLAYEWDEEENGIALLDILLGRGNKTVTIDNNNEIIGFGYTHNENIEKHNGEKINCNLFYDEDFQCVSAVLLTTAAPSVKYNNDNIVLFINPFAKNKIYAKDFWGLTYWKVDKKGCCSPRRRGRVLKNR